MLSTAIGSVGLISAPSFNPSNYQTGAVWPHDNGFIAQGFKRYGFHEETCRVAEAITQASDYFAASQLPELYAGPQRDGSNFPVQYLGANVPQGWAAGSIFSLLQAMLALRPTRRTIGCTSIRPCPSGSRSRRPRPARRETHLRYPLHPRERGNDALRGAARRRRTGDAAADDGLGQDLRSS